MRLFVLFLLAMIVAIPPSVAEGDLLTRQEFTERFLVELQDHYPEIKFDRVDEGSISYGAGTKSDDQGMVFTDYAYDLYVANPERLTDVINQWIAVLPAGNEIDESDASNRLVVVIRPPSYIDAIPAELRAEIVIRPFIGNMVALMMLDSPEKLSSASIGLLEENDLTVDEAFVLAESNTRRLIGEIYKEDYDGIEVLESSNGLITGLPWLPETCRAGVSDFAMMIVDREYLMQVDLNADPEAFEIFMHTATEMILSEESLGTGVFMCLDGTWSFATPTIQPREQ